MQRTEPRAPVRIVHLGLGAFVRAHLAWYTEIANQAAEGSWGIHAFTGRSPAAADALAAQDCLYRLIERGADGDSTSIISSIVRASDGADVAVWRSALADPATAILTLTITEAGYLVGPSDSAAARVVDGLQARFQASAGPIAIVSCDNLPANGTLIRDIVLALAERVDPALADWIRSDVSFVSTMVDRITPALDADDVDAGSWDAIPVVTEPLSEWVLCGEFPSGRPWWEFAGARFVEDIEPWEQRKLWLLNAGHSLLAYVGLLRGATTVEEIIKDPDTRDLLERLWTEAAEVLRFSRDDTEAAVAALRERFANPRIRHRLAQIASDGSQKLPPRILDVHRARRAAGLSVGTAGATVIAAWLLHLGGDPGLVFDREAAPLIAALRTGDADQGGVGVAFLAPDLASDAALVEAVNVALAALPACSETLAATFGAESQ